jgi:hypothetical protein
MVYFFYWECLEIATAALKLALNFPRSLFIGLKLKY